MHLTGIGTVWRNEKPGPGRFREFLQFDADFVGTKNLQAIKVGSRVKQGQVIGYVGSTGLATGPHLHYEFRINGKHTNPVNVSMPDAQPINQYNKAAFNKVTKERIGLINNLSSI